MILVAKYLYILFLFLFYLQNKVKKIIKIKTQFFEIYFLKNYISL